MHVGVYVHVCVCIKVSTHFSFIDMYRVKARAVQIEFNPPAVDLQSSLEEMVFGDLEDLLVSVMCQGSRVGHSCGKRFGGEER